LVHGSFEDPSSSAGPVDLDYLWNYWTSSCINMLKKKEARFFFFFLVIIVVCTASNWKRRIFLNICC
jgi:hypothetical protein